MMITHGIYSRIGALQAKPQFNQNNDRMIVAENAPDNAVKLLAEINETILSRTLQFTNDSGAMISLEVVGRRLLRLPTIDNLTTEVAIDELIGVPLSETEHLNDVLQVIQDFTDDAEEITVISSELEMGFGEYLIGLPVSDLSKRILGDQYKSEFSEKIDNVAFEILTHLDDAEAWLIVRSKEDQMSFGDPAVISMLQNYAENNANDVQSYLDQVSQTDGDRICTIIGKMTDDAKSIVCMRTKHELTFAIIPSEQTGKLLSNWKTENKID